MSRPALRVAMASEVTKKWASPPGTAVQPDLIVHHVQDVAAEETRPVLTVPPVVDRLERIEGIGPKIATALRQSGFTSFAALADADEDTLREALRTAHLRFAPSLPTWPDQARLLADGDEAGFAELTAGLVGGRGTSGVS